jgi:hypothetical protein
MLPSDTAGWIGLTLALIVALPVLAIGLLLINENTKALNEQKALRAELDEIMRDASGIGAKPTDEQVTAIYARLDRYQRRFADLQRSPFVISRS